MFFEIQEIVLKAGISLTAIFASLKLFGVFNCPWWGVFTPWLISSSWIVLGGMLYGFIKEFLKRSNGKE